ncbi:MFS transporter [Pseudomonas aeruginosa]|nr:MFS transporter [Pseudomonas aeruginosa]
MPSTVSSSRLGLAGLCILLAGQLLPMIDFSIVNVALDALAHSLGASETELELIVAVYGVAFAVCLAMGGRLGDNYGRRRLFDLGVALFAVASLLCGLAGSVWLLLVARALQGVGAALIVPQILATLHVSLSGHAHSRALAAYGAIGGLAFVVGQVLGGFLVSADIGGLGWRSVFLINLPICLGILLCSRRWVPETRAEHAARVDAPGTLLLAALILCLLLPLALGPSLHWSWPCALLLAAAVPLLAWLWRTELRQERRQAWPLLPPSLLRLPSIRFGLLLAILFFACWSGFMFALALALQAGAGLAGAGRQCLHRPRRLLLRLGAAHRPGGGADRPGTPAAARLRHPDVRPARPDADPATGLAAAGHPQPGAGDPGDRLRPGVHRQQLLPHRPLGGADRPGRRRRRHARHRPAGLPRPRLGAARRGVRAQGWSAMATTWKRRRRPWPSSSS